MMMNRKWLGILSLSSAIMITSAQAAEDCVTFTNFKGDGDWTNVENWQSRRGPDSHKVVRLSPGTVAKITNSVVIGALRNGFVKPSDVIIDGGSLTATATNEWSSACNSSPGASLTIQNGGSFVASCYFMVGMKNTPGGKVTIHQGTLRVAGKYFHNIGYSGEEVLNTQTTINTGGVLDVETLVLNAGVLYVDGGKVVIRKDCREQVNQWLETGRIIAMSGIDGWRIKVTYDYETGCTTLTAEEEPIVLGQTSSAPEHEPQHG